MTEWRRIPEHDGFEVSRCGQVRRLGCSEPLSQSKVRYAVAALRGHGARRVHRLVALAFILNPAGKPFINHIDCDKLNNHADNLEWCTQSENMRHAAANGRNAAAMAKVRGKRSPRARLTDEQVIYLRSLPRDQIVFTKLAKEWGVERTTLHTARSGKCYKHVRVA